MTYPQWWERLVAGIIDGIILAIVGWVLREIFISIAISTGSITMVQLLGIIAVLVSVAFAVGYKVFFEGGSWQATPGKMVFGLKVGDGSGNVGARKAVLMRTWPWWIQVIIVIPILLLSPTLNTVFGLIILGVMIAVFVSFFMDPKGRCIHDQTADLHVAKSGKSMVGG
jgi:uncharacterized RDD family membrane protein YckC